VVGTFVCPSDGRQGRVPSSAYGATNYAACAGSGAAAGTLTEADGVFFLASEVSIKDVTDGTSNTAAFSERPLGPGESIDPGSTELILELPFGTDPTETACRSPSGVEWNSERGAKWIVGNYGNTLYNHALRPNALEWDCMNASQQKGRFAARSEHPGGVNMLQCDGSAASVNGAVDLAIWAAAATRAGGELER
jgi:prepilin-type processing-associated H-X9-DG protein